MGKYIENTSLVGKHKAFNIEQFEKYDPPAREKIKQALGDFIEDNPDIYKQDFVVKDPEFKYKYIEIQVCAGWIDEYPHDKVYIYERKYQYEDDTLFITLNKTLTKGFIFDKSGFKNTKPRRIKKYSREFVYDIPWNKIMPINLAEFDVDIIKLF
jgi:hypothetical protein